VRRTTGGNRHGGTGLVMDSSLSPALGGLYSGVLIYISDGEGSEVDVPSVGPGFLLLCIIFCPTYSRAICVQCMFYLPLSFRAVNMTPKKVRSD
jgi:hypothetical protein